MHSIVKEDLEFITAAKIAWEDLEGKNILITGANGFLPAYMIETILFLNDHRFKNKAKIFALARNKERVLARFSGYGKRKDLIFIIQDVCTPFKISKRMDFIIHAASQVWKIKEGQRFLTTGGLSSMGYWVASIGGCIANNRRRTVVITGDGSLQMNIQELATIKHNNLPIKIIIFNNNGYLLIRHTQKNFMGGRLLGESPDTGVWCPDSLKIAQAYGIKGVRINKVSEVEPKIKEVMEHDGPVICDVMTPEWQLIIPRISSERMPDGTLVSKPYEDMYPYLSREELRKNMVSELNRRTKE